jgi:hypothetical protein
LDGSFEGLFDSAISQEQDYGGGEKGGSKFIEYYGWQYCTKLVADYENCTVSQAYELPTIEYLNILSYLKAERDFKK